MAQDQFKVEPEPPEKARPRGLVFAGVLAACVLGAGFGLWARPTSIERGAPRPAKQAVAPPNAFTAGTMQIVVDDTPAPIGRLLEVLPAQVGEAVYAAAREPVAADPPPAIPVVPVEPVAPRRPTTGLMKVADPVAQPEPEDAVRAIAVPAPPPKAKPAGSARPKAVKAKTETSKPRSEKAKVAKVEPKLKTRPAKPVQLAKAETRKAVTAKPEKAKAEGAKAEKVKTAKAETKAQAKRSLTKLARAAKAVPRKVREDARAAAKNAEAKRLARLEASSVEKARTEKARKAKARKIELAKAAPPKPKPARVQPRGEGPLRQVRNDRCGSADPGEALVCANPRLSVRERQMQRAYREAEAAGVSPDQLRRQQQRWLSTRAAAARDAPWAVEEVYEARIAELNDQSRGSDY